jgi:hypothetical protein
LDPGNVLAVEIARLLLLLLQPFVAFRLDPPAVFVAVKVMSSFV